MCAPSAPTAIEPDKKPVNKFVVPSVEEVRAYALEAKLADHADAFRDYYTANGWRVGRNPMKDWRSAYRNWCRNELGFSKGKGNGRPNNTPDNYIPPTPPAGGGSKYNDPDNLKDPFAEE